MLLCAASGCGRCPGLSAVLRRASPRSHFRSCQTRPLSPPSRGRCAAERDRPAPTGVSAQGRHSRAPYPHRFPRRRQVSSWPARNSHLELSIFRPAPRPVLKPGLLRWVSPPRCVCRAAAIPGEALWCTVLLLPPEHKTGAQLGSAPGPGPWSVAELDSDLGVSDCNGMCLTKTKK